MNQLIGIDIGGTQIKMGAFSPNGNGARAMDS